MAGDFLRTVWNWALGQGWQDNTVVEVDIGRKRTAWVQATRKWRHTWRMLPISQRGVKFIRDYLEATLRSRAIDLRWSLYTTCSGLFKSIAFKRERPLSRDYMSRRISRSFMVSHHRQHSQRIIIFLFFLLFLLWKPKIYQRKCSYMKRELHISWYARRNVCLSA